MSATELLFYRDALSSDIAMTTRTASKTPARRKKKAKTDAIGIIDRRYFQGKPEMLRLLEEERAHADIARTVYRLRTRARLTQRDLARRVGTTASAI